MKAIEQYCILILNKVVSDHLLIFTCELSLKV